MRQAKRASKGKRPGKAVSVLGIAGVSFAASTGGSPAEMPSASLAAPTAGSAVEALWRNTAAFQVPTLDEEEISDVSLATFHLLDKDRPRKPRVRHTACRLPSGRLRLRAWRRVQRLRRQGMRRRLPCRRLPCRRLPCRRLQRLRRGRLRRLRRRLGLGRLRRLRLGLWLGRLLSVLGGLQHLVLDSCAFR